MKKIKIFVVFFRRKLRYVEPISRKLETTIRHVFSPENSEGEHLFRRQIWLKIRMKILPLRFGKEIFIPLLHFVMDDDFLSHTPVVSRIQEKEKPPQTRGLYIIVLNDSIRSDQQQPRSKYPYSH